MIISHKHKFIFVKTRKTAGTSFETLLASICDSSDVITEISEEKIRLEKYGLRFQNTTIHFKYYTLKDWLRLIFKFKKKKFHSHMPAHEIQKYVSTYVWNNYFKFCLERNPWDKTISHFFWRGGYDKYNSIEGYLNSRDFERTSNFKLYSEDGKIIIDKIYQLESIDECIEELSEKFRCEFNYTFSDIKFKTNQRKDKRNYKDVLNPNSADRIARLHEKEITLLNYKY
ncbi:sulfotransferase family 2 domain-containing protein [Marinoscillum pacificum]|uniref:sulfotransferase family 2 domain-containing protein n=1 Tax=Marinoscillum pacificum TaxID=392723 RepID=UPI0021572F86|nr:sulfotransferase family 2 domain-containing protein [Marinoscillum pacificum]